MQKYSTFSVVTFTIIQKEISLQVENLLKSQELRNEFFDEFKMQLFLDSTFLNSLKIRIKDELKQELKDELKQELKDEFQDHWEKIDNI
jgi:hypothetical protein